MGILNLIRKFIYTDKKFFCIFCEKLHVTDNQTVDMKIDELGICIDCQSKLFFTGYQSSFDGTKSVSYILSPFYYDGEIRKTIRRFKFNDCYKYADVFADRMIDYLEEYPYIYDFDLVIPVPLSKQRMRERGYNQTGLIAKKIAKHFSLDYSENILFRIKNTKKQSLMTGIERFHNVHDAFTAKGDLSDKKVLLVDDIFTYGYTMEACGETLKKIGAYEIVGLTLSIVKKS